MSSQYTNPTSVLLKFYLLQEFRSPQLQSIISRKCPFEAVNNPRVSRTSRHSSAARFWDILYRNLRSRRFPLFAVKTRSWSETVAVGRQLRLFLTWACGYNRNRWLPSCFNLLFWSWTVPRGPTRYAYLIRGDCHGPPPMPTFHNIRAPRAGLLRDLVDLLDDRPLEAYPDALYRTCHNGEALLLVTNLNTLLERQVALFSWTLCFIVRHFAFKMSAMLQVVSGFNIELTMLVKITDMIIFRERFILFSCFFCTFSEYN